MSNPQLTTPTGKSTITLAKRDLTLTNRPTQQVWISQMPASWTWQCSRCAATFAGPPHENQPAMKVDDLAFCRPCFREMMRRLAQLSSSVEMMDRTRDAIR